MRPLEIVVDVGKGVDAWIEEVDQLTVGQGVRARDTVERELRRHDCFEDTIREDVASPVAVALHEEQAKIG